MTAGFIRRPACRDATEMRRIGCPGGIGDRFRKTAITELDIFQTKIRGNQHLEQALANAEAQLVDLTFVVQASDQYLERELAVPRDAAVQPFGAAT